MSTIDPQSALAALAASPNDNGQLELIVLRPVTNARRVVDHCELSKTGGLHGDSWAKGCWKKLPDGSPHPDVQISLMNSRCIQAIAGTPENWPPAGDNLFVDFDLSLANLKPGDQLAIGSAIIQLTNVDHAPCGKFSSRYGQDAFQFLDDPEHKTLNLRGIFARVVKDGQIATGDRIRKVQPDLGLD